MMRAPTAVLLLAALLFQCALCVHADEAPNDTEFDSDSQTEHLQTLTDSQAVPERLTEEIPSTIPLINEESWYHTLDDFQNVMVLFTQSNAACAECEAAEKAVLDVMIMYSGKKVHFAKLDCWEDLPICRKYGVERHPTIKLFSQGTAIFDFKETVIHAGTLSYFIAKYSAEKVKEISLTQLDDFLKAAKSSSVVGFFDETTQKEAGSFNRTAAQLFPKGYSFGYVDITKEVDSDLMERYDILPGSIMVFRKDRKAPVVYTGKVSRKRLSSWIDEVAPQWVTEVTDGWGDFMDAGRPILCLWLDYSRQQEADGLVDMLRDVAVDADFKNEVTFVYDNGFKRRRLLERFGKEEKGLPFAIYYDLQKKTVHVMDKEVTADNLKEFVGACMRSEIPAYIRTQQSPYESSEALEASHLKQLVYSTFRPIAMDPRKDVLVLFYLTDSDPCKGVMPVWQRIAEALKDVDSLWVAQMDMTQNESAPGYPVWSFPTISLFKVGEKNQPTVYVGAREFEPILQWIQENVSAKFELDDSVLAGLNAEKTVM